MRICAYAPVPVLCVEQVLRVLRPLSVVVQAVYRAAVNQRLVAAELVEPEAFRMLGRFEAAHGCRAGRFARPPHHTEMHVSDAAGMLFRPRRRFPGLRQLCLALLARHGSAGRRGLEGPLGGQLP